MALMLDDTAVPESHTPPADATCLERWATTGVAHACSWISHEGDVHKCVCGDVWDTGKVGCRAAIAAPERCRCHNREGLEPGQHENDCPLILARNRSDVQEALDALDDLLDLDALSEQDIDAVDAWANNAQLDIMRHRRRQGVHRV